MEEEEKKQLSESRININSVSSIDVIGSTYFAKESKGLTAPVEEWKEVSKRVKVPRKRSTTTSMTRKTAELRQRVTARVETESRGKGMKQRATSPGSPGAGTSRGKSTSVKSGRKCNRRKGNGI